MKWTDNLIAFFGSQVKAAKELKVSQQAVHQWCSGMTTPSPTNAKKIQILTKEKIKIADIYHIDR